MIKESALREKLCRIPQDMPYLVIEKTAKRLEDMNFSPTLLFPINDFLHLSKSQMLKEFDNIAKLKRNDLIKLGMPEEEDFQSFREKQLSLMVYWFRLLSQLRKDSPEAWDEVNELYEDD